LAIGSLVIPPIVTALIPLYGWRISMRLLAAATFLLIVPTAWLLLGRIPAADADPPSISRVPQWTTLMLLRNRDFQIICAGFAALLSAYLPVLYNIGAYARDIGVSQPQAAFAVAWSAPALTLGKLGFGKLADLLEHRRLYWIAVAPMLLGVVMVSTAGAFPQLLVGLLLVSFGQGCYLPLLASMIVARFGARSFGQVLGLAAILTQTSAVSPYLAGVIRDGTGSYTAAFLALSLPLLPAMIAMRWLSSRSGSPDNIAALRPAS
jgi:MFS family permease